MQFSVKNHEVQTVKQQLKYIQFVKKVKIKNNTHVKKTHPKRKSLHSNKCHPKKWAPPPTPPVQGLQ